MKSIAQYLKDIGKEIELLESFYPNCEIFISVPQSLWDLGSFDKFVKYAKHTMVPYDAIDFIRFDAIVYEITEGIISHSSFVNYSHI